MQAILLAGGLGTRLRSVVSDRPKPMALIQEKPFMEYVIRELKRHGIDEIIFAVGYKGTMVEEYFGDGSAFGVKTAYAYEEELLGFRQVLLFEVGFFLCLHSFLKSFFL